MDEMTLDIISQQLTAQEITFNKEAGTETFESNYGEEDESIALKNTTDPAEMLTKNLFEMKGFVSNESWEKFEYVHSKIIKVSKNQVYCDCILDRDNKVFRTRKFPINLFRHFDSLKEGNLIIVKISSKAGSTRTDIIDGRGIVNAKYFETKDLWDELKDSGLDKPFKL